MHPWHDVELGDVKQIMFNVVIEVPKGSKNKYELDKKSGLIKVDRVLFSSVHYPANYGFFPQTLGEDNDPLDALVLGQLDVVPLAIVRARPIGIMRMLDQGEPDDKIICIHVDDPEYAHYKSLRELPPHRLNEVKRFFEDYKVLENKKVVVEDFEGPKEALKAIKNSIELYRERFLKRLKNSP